MNEMKIQGSSARWGRSSTTLCGRTGPFRSLICVHFDCDRHDCAPLCSLICAVRRIHTLQILGTSPWMQCATIGFCLETHPSASNMRCVNVNPPLFKAAIGPKLACMMLKSGLERHTPLKKWQEVDPSIYCFCLVGRAASLVSKGTENVWSRFFSDRS